MFLTLVSVNKLIKITSKSSERHADCYYSSSVLITDLNLHLKNQHGNSQWLGLCTSTAGGVSLIPDEGTKIITSSHDIQAIELSSFMVIESFGL